MQPLCQGQRHRANAVSKCHPKQYLCVSKVEEDYFCKAACMMRLWMVSQLTNRPERAVSVSNCCQRCQGMTTNWVPACHIVQGLEVQALVCDNQATPLLHKWGELDSRRVILDLLTEVDQATVVKCSFRCTQPSAYLHSSRQGWLCLDTIIIGR